MIWLSGSKLPNLCAYKLDVYSAFTYLPPASSVFFKKNLNCDIFSELDFFWCNYLNQGGHLFLLPDFIENYSLHDDVLDGLFTYTADWSYR